MPKKNMNSKVSNRILKDSTVKKLWAISAGRCQICNKLLYLDSTLGEDGVFAENAHIHAVSQNGPRHKNDILTDELNSCENLMLLCSEHHHLIDTKPEDYTDGILIRYKMKHEERIRVAAEVTEYKTSRILSYFSNIDLQRIPHDDMHFKRALRKADMFPLQYPVIKLHEQVNIQYEPSKEGICKKAEDLEHSFKCLFSDIVDKTEAISVFALAPQPLLIKLGSLINDQYNTFVFQCHRDEDKWSWKGSSECPEYLLIRPSANEFSSIALVIDLSAKVLDDRITTILGEDVGIFHITIPDPNRHFVTNMSVVESFRNVFRQAIEEIKNRRPAPHIIHLFPAMPNSLAITVGMDFMPKTDIPMLVYEQSQAKEGFFDTITIGG